MIGRIGKYFRVEIVDLEREQMLIKYFLVTFCEKRSHFKSRILWYIPLIKDYYLVILIVLVLIWKENLVFS